jgi:transposase
MGVPSAKVIHNFGRADAVERKLLRRCYHTLRELGDVALAPVTQSQEVAA